MSATDDLLQNAREYAASFDKADLPLPPARKVAVLACMDSRLDLVDPLGLDEGDAHMMRNAGGVITDDVIRSLAISQRRLGTREIVLIHHTDCGMQKLTDDGFRAASGRDRHGAGVRDRDLHRRRRGRAPVDRCASRRARSSPTATPCAGSSTTCTQVRCARCPDPPHGTTSPTSSVPF